MRVGSAPPQFSVSAGDNRGMDLRHFRCKVVDNTARLPVTEPTRQSARTQASDGNHISAERPWPAKGSLAAMRGWNAVALLSTVLQLSSRSSDADPEPAQPIQV